MISILIPIYNDSIIDLVRALHQQCVQANIDFEIICLDDYSEAVYREQNVNLAKMPQVNYIELSENIGRSRIRNRLADLAQYPYLLFMDGDSKVTRSSYIQSYLSNLDSKQVIYGGRMYDQEPPLDNSLFLHWRYGRQRESTLAKDRMLFPYRSFMTNNFVVPKAITQQIQFDESLFRYGYEDTLYAVALKKAGIPLLHIDNPLEHLGLEKHQVFLRKMEDALDNLQEILPKHPEIDTRLLQFVNQLRKWRLAGLVKAGAPLLMPIFKQLLTFNKMPLWILDVYKLCYFLRKK